MKPNRRSQRPSLICLLVAATGLSLLSGCGGESTTPTVVTTPPPTPPPPRVVLQGNRNLDVNFAFGEYFTTDRAGTLEAIVDHTFANSLILVWIARDQCTAELFDAEQCNYAATSFAGSKPRRVSFTGAAAGTYTLIVGNGGPQAEAVSYQVVLTPSASSASTRTGESLPTSQRGWFGVRLPQR
jgi:hypothetical protein